ncbi:MAG: cation-translocating P-type ATPase [Patescibacteria group bacterium]|nr:cation-translocating P-type ATPase [Patescibacteria group bacterium]
MNSCCENPTDTKAECCDPATKKDGSSGFIAKNKKFIILIFSVAVVLLLEILSFTNYKLPTFIEWTLVIVFLFVFGRKVFMSGLKKLIKFDFSSINLLMSVAVIGALLLGKTEEAVIITVLFALAEELETIGMKRSKKALEDLVNKTPKLVLLKDEKEPVAIESVKIGAIFIVKPGDIIPLDGEVVNGTSMVDEATITGEPIPKTKTIGDTVYAGTQNMNGAFEVKATKTAENTTIAKIIGLTAQATTNKSQTQEFIEKFSTYYTPTILTISILLVVVPVVILGQDFNFWFLQSLTLLIISCPCSLVISTPMAVFSAMGNANKRGILVKGGRFLEAIGSIKAIAFDKTRTLTKGEVVVTDVIALNGYTESEILTCAAGLEHFSEHPLSVGILKKAKELALDYKPVNNFKAVAGKGVKGDCLVCNSVSYLGSPRYIENVLKIDQGTIELIKKNESEGKSVIVVGNKDKIQGLIIVEDEIKKESADLIRSLVGSGVIPIMLTGDNEKVASFVGKKIGIKEIYASLLPENKSEKMAELIAKYEKVAMVGDGINDAPALAGATVGITMGAAGSDIAIESADVAIMDDNVLKIASLIKLGRKTKNIIYTNIAFSLGVKILFVTLAMSGNSSLVFAIMADVGVTIVVILNSLRLFRAK